MASRTLFKIKINKSFPQCFLPQTSSILTRSVVASIAQPETSQIFLSRFRLQSGISHNLFARQMSSSRPRGSVNNKKDDDDDEEEDFDEDNDDEFDDDDDDTYDLDDDDFDDDEEEVEEEVPKKKSYRK